ncbi:MAG TPA: GNAT family N-acetyltransferase [Candidatus Limnocylindrales bacterium]|nr:GNAT family N-acetyltransferase [Candidatus Limnocylindrales bacterium]
MTAAAAAAPGTVSVRELGADDLAGWDEAAVDAPGGHVLQSRAWAEHRRERGWRARFLAAGEGRVLALTRPWPRIGGGSAYVPRGPAGLAARSARDAAATLLAVADQLAADGIDVIAADAEVPAAEAAYRSAITARGFRPIEEIQPSRHRMSLPLPPGTDEAAVLSGVAKSTRQRLRRAEKDGTVVVRHDRRADRGAVDGLVDVPVEAADEALDRFYGLLRLTGDRRGFGFAGPDEFVHWWRRALDAGHLVLLEGRDGSADGEVLGGLLLYRHGGRLSTQHSGDLADRRRDRPGTMHLLRWRAIQLALAEGRHEMDLGGVDVAGARRPPREDEPMHGLYEHKRSFGAEWLELTGAHELVVRPWRYAAGRVVGRIGRLAR